MADIGKGGEERPLDAGALAAAHAALRGAFDALAIETAILDDGGVILAVNAAWARAAREAGALRPGEPVGTNYVEACETAGGSGAGEARRAAGGLREVLAGQRAVFLLQYSVAAPGAGDRWFILRASRFETGGLVRALVTHEDVSPLVRARSAAQLRDRAMASFSLGVLITDASLPDNPIVYCNPAVERMTGYGAAELIGRNARMLQGKDTDRATVARVREAIARGRPVSAEIRNYRKDGSWFWNLMEIDPIRDDAGAVTHFVGVQHDITEWHRLEEQVRQSQKIEAVGRLAGGVAHDFNNLLTVIVGYTQLALDDLPADNAARAGLEEVLNVAARATDLAAQLLAFGRKTIAVPQVLDPAAILRDFGRMLRRLIGEDIHLVVRADPGVGAVRIDPSLFYQALLNLAVNARDAMPGGGTLLIHAADAVLEQAESRSAGVAPAGEYVAIAVRDTGVGMPPEVMARTFEPFFTTKEVGRGTGLGLATTYGIVQQAGGHIEIASEPGKGSTFTVYLPRVSDAVAAAVEPPATTGLPAGSETVLLVEDETAVRVLMRGVLLTCGYRVLEASNGPEALRVSQEHAGRIDLLATNLVMPGMTGRDLAERLRAARPEVKVLYLSGYTEDEFLRAGIRAEDVAFLPKPYTPSVLAHKIREVLGRSDAEPA